MYKFIPLSLAACALFAGCSMENGQAFATRPAPPPQAAILSTGQRSNARISDAISRTTTTVTGDSTRTETTSSSVSVDGGGLIGALLGVAPHSGGNTTSDYAGTWRVSSPNNSECRLTLQPAKIANGPANVQNTGCFQELMGVSRWGLWGNALVLTDSLGATKARVRATGRNRLEGGGVTMWR